MRRCCGFDARVWTTRLGVSSAVSRPCLRGCGVGGSLPACATRTRALLRFFLLFASQKRFFAFGVAPGRLRRFRVPLPRPGIRTGQGGRGRPRGRLVSLRRLLRANKARKIPVTRHRRDPPLPPAPARPTRVIPGSPHTTQRQGWHTRDPNRPPSAFPGAKTFVRTTCLGEIRLWFQTATGRP